MFKAARARWKLIVLYVGPWLAALGYAVDWWQRATFVSEKTGSTPKAESPPPVNPALEVWRSPGTGVALIVIAIAVSGVIVLRLMREVERLKSQSRDPLARYRVPPSQDPRSLAEPAPEDAAEAKLVERLRSICVLDGKESVQTMVLLFAEAAHNSSRNYLVDMFVKTKTDDLQRAWERLAVALGNERKPRSHAREVIDRFNEMYGAYLQAIKWTVTLQTHEGAQVDDYDQRIESWVSLHRRFYSKLLELVHERPEYNKLKIVALDAGFGSRWDAYHAVLRQAEARDS